MKCRFGFTSRMTRVFSASPHSLVHLCAAYQLFGEVKSCYVTVARDGDSSEIDWFLLWRKDNGGVPIYTENLPVTLIGFKNVVISELASIVSNRNNALLKQKLRENDDDHRCEPWIQAIL